MKSLLGKPDGGAAAGGGLESGHPGIVRRVLMLTWEFPPMVVGGLSRHVFDLSRHLVKQGVEVHVLTSQVEGYPDYEINQGVRVHRVATFQSKELNFLEWVFQLNLAMFDYSHKLLRQTSFDVLHAHDWLVVYAAKAIKHTYGLPLAATIHATEHGRNQGLHSELQHRIHGLEWQLTYEARRVITCSRFMRDEVRYLFNLPDDKLDVIGNGVDPQAVRVFEHEAEWRSQLALPSEKLVVFVGRLVREKGVHVLLDSALGILQQCPEAKFIIAGNGPERHALEKQAEALGLGAKVLFLGQVDEDTRNRLLRLASVAVFPSLYEPFGIAPLEAMAAGSPVVVSGVGGLQETIEYGVDGWTVLPGNVPSLVSHVIKVLSDDLEARTMAIRAFEKVFSEYSWEHIAVQTVACYDQLWHHYGREEIRIRQEVAAAL